MARPARPARIDAMVECGMRAIPPRGRVAYDTVRAAAVPHSIPMSWGVVSRSWRYKKKKSSPTQSDSRYLLISVGATRELVVVRDHSEHLRELLYPVIELAPNHLAHEEVEVSTEGEA